MIKNTRIVVLDTETTGMNQGAGSVAKGHRVIEIGAVEIINRQLTGNHFHVYLKPDRLIDPDATKIHGITDEFLADKPDYSAIHQQFVDFIRGTEFIAHNASFDVAFINQEFSLYHDIHDIKTDHSRSEQKPLIVSELCTVIDSLTLARSKFPGKRNTLDALCQRLEVDSTKRVLHGALLDAELLAEVYLRLTGGQRLFNFDDISVKAPENKIEPTDVESSLSEIKYENRGEMVVQLASESEQKEHDAYLEFLNKKSEVVIWRT